MSARFYDPTTSQFLSRDPLAAMTRSPYGYVYGNPLNAVDPSGLYCLSGVSGHNPDGSEICNGAGEVASNVVNAAVVTSPIGMATQANCVMWVTCPDGSNSVRTETTGGQVVFWGASIALGASLFVATGAGLGVTTALGWGGLGAASLLILPSVVESVAAIAALITGDCDGRLHKAASDASNVPQPKRPASPGQPEPVDPFPPAPISGPPAP